MLKVEYNCFLNLTDHTGTYGKCVFTNSATEMIFGIPAKEFAKLSINDRAQMKWKLLLNRFKVSKCASHRCSRCQIHNAPTMLLAIMIHFESMKLDDRNATGRWCLILKFIINHPAMGVFVCQFI